MTASGEDISVSDADGHPVYLNLIDWDDPSVPISNTPVHDQSSETQTGIFSPSQRESTESSVSALIIPIRPPLPIHLYPRSDHVTISVYSPDERFYVNIPADLKPSERAHTLKTPPSPTYSITPSAKVNRHVDDDDIRRRHVIRLAVLSTIVWSAVSIIVGSGVGWLIYQYLTRS